MFKTVSKHRCIGWLCSCLRSRQREAWGREIDAPFLWLSSKDPSNHGVNRVLICVYTLAMKSHGTGLRADVVLIKFATRA